MEKTEGCFNMYVKGNSIIFFIIILTKKEQPLGYRPP